MPPTPLPRDVRRIWIVGPCGSGKSTLARQIGRERGLPVHHLDELYHLPGWNSLEPRDFDLTVQRLCRRDAWIIDGNYGAVRRPHLLKASFIVWLDLPLRITLPRLLHRSLRRAAFRVPCCNGNYETFRQVFASRESILLWALQADRKRARNLAREVTPLPHARLRTPREVRRWMRASFPSLA